MAKRKRKKRGKRGGGRLSPGVYLEEISSGARPIESVGTAVAAFVGFARSHPLLILGAAALVGAIAARALKGRR